MQDVNIFPGRFQPFHSGHLRCCEDIYKENGNPVVILYMSTTKFDKRKPFDNELIRKELEIVKKNNKFIADIFEIKNPVPTPMIKVCEDAGYHPTVWIAGEDRIPEYQKLLDKGKFTTFTKPELVTTNRYCSATEVRQTILDDDKTTFEKLMPKGTTGLWDEFREAVLKVNENQDYNLKDYIIESINFENILDD